MTNRASLYHRYLGIPRRIKEPTLYQLLGIDLFENDQDVIEIAADRQMNHLQRYESGEHAEHISRMLSEVAKARLCLTNPDKKAHYDKILRSKQSSSEEKNLDNIALDADDQALILDYDPADDIALAKALGLDQQTDTTERAAEDEE